MKSNQEQLEAQIIEANKAYRDGTPIMSDEQYDKLIEDFKIAFPNSPLFKKGVIEQPKESRKQRLPIPMFSLNKCKSIQEIEQWLKSNNIPQDEILVITSKYDGISLVVNEANKNAWTRGDGEYGQESKWHFNKLRGSNCDHIEAYTFGEAIMSKKSFENYKEEYANARNMVAGLFNRDITTMPLQDVDYIRYGSDETNLSKVIQLEALNELNSIEVPFKVASINEIENSNILERCYKEWSKDYQIDGLVIDINSPELRNNLGREENMNPKYARAYKNPEWSSSAIVKVKSVKWEVSKQGKLKPVIQIPPTEVSGVVIENVTGYNAKYIFDNDIAEGSEIKIIRSGDVIPKHIKTLSHLPNNVEELADTVAICPSCGEQTKWDETFTELVCINPNCEDKKIAKLVHFFKTVEIEDFGEPSIITFYKNGFDTIEKILNMKQFDIVNIEGFGVKSSMGLLRQFGKLKTEGIPLAKLLHALDVFEGKIGEKMCQKIFDEFENVNEMIRTNLSPTAFTKFYTEELLKIEGVAELTAKIFQKGINRFYFYNSIEIDTSVAIEYIKTPKPKVVGDKLKDERICFTGCRPSKEQLENISLQGGTVVSGVSKKTTMLVVKNMTDKVLSSSKACKAKELGIKIIELRKLEV